MRRTVVALLCALLAAEPALAADNAIVLTPGSGVTEASKDIGGGVQSPKVNIIDGSGNPCYGTAGTPGTCVLTLQGVSGGQAVKVDGSAVTQPVSGTVTANQGTAAAVTAPWPINGGVPAATTGTFTNATQTGNVTTGTITGYGVATISINGTYGTATAAFYLSDDGGTTFYPVQASRADGTAIETGYSSLTNTSRMWRLPVGAGNQVRVLSSAVASGTVNVRITVSAAPQGADGSSFHVDPAQVYTAGTAGSASSSVLTEQGIASMTPLRTFPVGTALTEGGITPVVCGSAVSSCVLKASAGNLYSVYAECSSACWLMVFNSTSAQSNGSTTAGTAANNMVDCIPIGAGGSGSISMNGLPPAIFSTGITAMISSTTCATLTTSTVGFVKGMVM